MTLDNWYWALQVGSVLIALLAFACLAGTTLAGRFINRRDSARLVVLERDLTVAKLALAEQQERAARAELDLLQLRVAMADRRLTAEQQDVLTNALAGHVAAGYTVWIRSAPGDTEAERFGGDIDLALQRAGLTTVIHTDTANARPGIFVTCGESEGRDFGVSLAAALQTTGYTVAPFTNLGCGGTTDIYIGPKPAARVGP